VLSHKIKFRKFIFLLKASLKSGAFFCSERAVIYRLSFFPLEPLASRRLAGRRESSNNGTIVAMGETLGTFLNF